MPLKHTHHSDTKEQQGNNCAVIGEDVERDLFVKEYDGSRGRDLEPTTTHQLGDASIIKGETQTPLELESKNKVSTTDLVADTSADGFSTPIQQEEQAENDKTIEDELLSDREGISARNLQQQQIIVFDPQNLPEEVVLILFKFMKPTDILKASQTCQLWRILGENDTLWEQKCKEAGLTYSLTPANKRALDRCNESSPIAYSAWKEIFLKPYKIQRKLREGVPQVITIQMSHGVNKMEFYNDKIVTTFGTNLYVFCASSGELLHELVGHTKYVAEVQMGDQFIVSGSHDGSVKVWDIDTGSCVHTMDNMDTGGVAFLQMHGNIAVSGYMDSNALRVWDVREGRCHRTLRHYDDDVRRRNDRMREYNYRRGTNVPMEPEKLIKVHHVQFDGRFVVSGSEGNKIKIWDPETGDCLRTLSHRSYIQFLKFNGVDVVAGYDDGSVKVWEVNTGVCRCTQRFNCSQFMELQGDTLVWEGDDRLSVKIWNMPTGVCLLALSEHRRAISGIAANDKLVVTSSSTVRHAIKDGTVKLWDMKSGEFIRDMLVLEAKGTVEKIKMEDAKIVCVVKSKEGLKLLVLNFDTNDLE